MQHLTLLGALSAICTIAAPAGLAQRPVLEIQIAGNERLSPEAVIAASGLHLGQNVTRAGLDAATQKLFETGFFTSVNYRYDPKLKDGVNGYGVTFKISEEPARISVELDIPGKDQEQLWQQLKSADGLIDRQIPDNERAWNYLARATEAVLRKSNDRLEIITKAEADIHTGKMALSCRPAHLPKVTSMRFEGNAALTSGALEGALAKVALGEDFMERDFRRKLELNVRPLYEELGHLTVKFSHINMAGGGDAVTVTSEIDEGPVWRLGKVDLSGEALPVEEMRGAAHFALDAPANWRRFLLSINDMEKVLRRDGYVTVTSSPLRQFRESGDIVDVKLQVNKGRQYHFGEMHIEGFDAETRQHLAERWNLPRGAPMNDAYPTEFLRSVLPSLAGRYKTVRSRLEFHTGSEVVDVVISFR